MANLSKRPALEVFVNDLGTISIRRLNDDEAILVIGADEVATLIGADLSSALLSGACFEKATLHSANLDGQDLSGLDLSGAQFGKARLRGVVFTKAKPVPA